MAPKTRTLDQLIGWDDLLEPGEQMVRESVARFVTERCTPRIVEAFETGTFPDDLTPEIAELGVLGGPLDGYGCAGMSSVAWGLACAELERCDSGLRSFASVQTSLVMYAISRFGSEAQRDRWLPEMAAGRAIGCFGLTEPDHGSDPGSMATRAREVGGGWELSGSKTWITNAQIADVAVVWARLGDTPDTIRGFLVERDTPGFSASGIPLKLSMRASHTGSLHFSDAVIPASARLPEAAGLRAPLSCLNNARFGVAFGVLGAAMACLEQGLGYVTNRTQFGVPLARKQLVQKELADVASEIVKAAVLSVHFGRLKDAGRLHPAQVSLLKRNNCAMALEAARRIRGIMGANGVSGEYHVMRHAMNLESTYTYEGTHEIHTLALGRALTGESAF